MAQAIPLVFSVAGAKIAGMAFAGSQLAMGIGWMAGGMLGSMLFPQKSASHKMPQMAEYPVQSSSRGMPVPIIYGTRKVAGNIIWLGDLSSYVIVHKSSGGGKGGGGGGGETQEIRYRRSFLIAICEGPANIMRIWEGKTEISVESASIYNGMDNIGIPNIVNETYGEYQDVLCAYFDSYELGNSQQLPNFTFEVQAGPVTLFTGCDVIGAGSYTAAKCRPDGTLDDTFATDGIFKIEYSPSSGTNAICESAIDGSIYVAQGQANIIDDYYARSMTNAVGTVAIGDTVIGSIGAGKFLVENIYYKPATDYGLVWLKHISGPFGAANEIYDDGSGNKFTIPTFTDVSWKTIAKLTARGKLDKSWGEGGYKWISGTTIGWLVEDKNGNLYGGINLGGGTTSVFSLNANGNIRWIHGYDGGTRVYPIASYAAVLSQDHEYIYIACDLTARGGISSQTTDYNVIKLKTSNGTHDTTWSTDGFFMQGSHHVSGVPNAFAIVRVWGTEEIIFHHYDNLINNRRYSITKLNASGFRDTSWGEEHNGMSGNYRRPVYASWCYHGSLCADEARNLFAASYYVSPTGVVNDGICYVEIYDPDGKIIYSFTV